MILRALTYHKDFSSSSFSIWTRIIYVDSLKKQQYFITPIIFHLREIHIRNFLLCTKPSSAQSQAFSSGYQCSWEKCKISLPRPLNFFSSCLPFCWTQPCLLQTSLGRWTTRYLRPQHTRMIRQFSVEETKSAKGKAGQAQNKESARFRNTLSFSINLSRRNPTEFLRFRATHLRAI